MTSTCPARSRVLFAVLLTTVLIPTRGMAQSIPTPAEADASALSSEAAKSPDGTVEAPQPESSTNTSLQPDASVEEILVAGTSVTDSINQARFSESIVDVLDAKDFQTTGDSSVVQALGRVTGVTTVGDKYVYVRGLGERYSSTLFDGATLPSPDPVRRVVPLDIFPSGVMEQLTVQKTYTPSLPADFAGGSVQLTTRSIPRERLLSFSVTTKANTQTTGKSTPWFEGGGADWTGFDDGFRDLPSGARTLDGATNASDRQSIGLGFERDFDVSNEVLPPGLQVNGVYADTWKTPAGTFGALLGGQGSNEWLYQKEERASANSPTTVGDYSTLKETTNSVDYTGLGTLTWSPAASQLVKATLFWSHLSDKRYAEEDPSYSAEADRFNKYIRTQFEQQSLLTARLSGSHEVKPMHDLLLDWGLTYSQAKRDAPDSRYYGYIYLDDDASDGLDQSSLRFGSAANNTREWESLTDNAWDSVVNGSIPFRITNDVLSTLRLGAKYFNKQRESEVLRYRFLTTRNPREYDQLPIDEIFADENIRPDYWQINQFSRDSDQYSAEEQVAAGYLQTETEIGDSLRLMVGTRFESAEQTTETGGTVDSVTEIRDDSFFPAVEMTWIMRSDLQLRAGWSQTVNRPDLREISEAIFINPENYYAYFGNKNLKAANLTNYDLRLEWYHGISDTVELAGFYKEIQDPIQEIALPQGNFRTWRNSEEATLWGIELAAQQNLAPLGRWADDFLVRTNGAYIQSEVTESADAPITNRKHPLQGQSEWIFNFQLTHDYLPWDMTNTLVLNVFGERIADVGSKPPSATTGRDDAYEQPAPTLDYVMRWGFEVFEREYELTLKAKNLINPKREVTRGQVTERSIRDGQFFSVQIGYDF